MLAASLPEIFKKGRVCYTSTMKQVTIFGFLLVLFGVVAAPAQTEALSCVDPASMMENYVDSSDYVIFTGVAGETIEHVKQAASTDGDPNRQFNEGYVGQHVTVTTAYKGQISGDLWVYHQQNSTWGYMCANGPADAGTETVYIIIPAQGAFGLVEVMNSYPADSDWGKDLIAALEAADDNGPAYINFTTGENWRQDLTNQIREMIYLIRIKLTEWRWWRDAD